MLPPRDPSEIERYTQTKSMVWKKIFHAYAKEKKLGQQYYIAVLIANKIDSKINAMVRDKENNPRREYRPSKHLCIQHRST